MTVCYFLYINDLPLYERVFVKFLLITRHFLFLIVILLISIKKTISN